ncbi:amidohydrolase family protein [Maribacter sp. MAR_2009_72]|uniref:amidohydrolase family protein n=1 Tax=Maribacter sp. MAR_2009_72 TaxID=1250050 RepID=UPI00119A1FCD|nr:amidohydrolase family protein [Maribacter sp. MAR_2009_72]TVZ15492.1 amidohydrolase family protein [Maribacter sp. MAR_2009_72]
MKKIKIVLVIAFFLTFVCQINSQEISKNSIALTNVTIIDVESSQELENMTIIIEKDKILSINPSGSIDLKGITNKIDLKGNYVIPGLIDSHVHLFRPKNRKEILTKLLYSGITTVRDMGGDARVYQSLNKEIGQSKLIGPDIYYSANVFGPTFLKDPRTKFSNMGFEPGSAPWMRLVEENSNLEKIVLEAKEAGVTGLKVYSNVNPELLAKISNVAHKNDLKMWSHSSIFPSRPSDAVNAKVDVLSHSVGMIFEMESEMPDSFNEAIRISVPLQDFKNTDASSIEFIELFKKMKSNNTIFEPTLSAWSLKLRSEKPKANKSIEKVNPTKQLSNAANKMDVASMDNWARTITLSAYENGVTIAAGTDFNSDIKWVQDEIILLTECGLSSIDAIKAATLNNAKVIGIENSYGSISEGKYANLVVLTENPLNNIENIRTVLSIYKNGIEYKVNE